MASNDKIFTIRIDGADTSITNLNQLRALITSTDRELKKADFGSEKFKELAARSADLKAKQKLLNDQFVGTQATADKMSNSFGMAFSQLGKLGGPVGALTGGLESLAGGAGEAGGALKGLAGAGPVAAVFGVIMLALSPLIAAFGRMPGLMDKITAAWEGTLAVGRQLAGMLADVGDAAIAFVQGDFEQAGKKVDEFVAKVENMGTTVADTFNKAFELAQQRQQLERTGAEIQRVTKILENQKAIIDAQAADESQTYLERIELIKKRGQIEAQIASQLQKQATAELQLFEKQLKADQYRTGVLVDGVLDRTRATEEEAKKYDELSVKASEANTRVVTSTINTNNQIIALNKARGEKLLELARIENDKEKILQEQHLAQLKRNSDTNAQAQIELIDKQVALRMEILQKEQDFIVENNSKNGKLNEEWTAKYADLEKLKLEATLQAENQKQETIKATQAIAIQRATAQKDFEIKASQQGLENDKIALGYQQQLLQLTEREAAVKLQIAQRSGSINDLTQAEQAANQVLLKQKELQTKELELQYSAQQAQLDLEKQKLQVELTALQNSANQTEADRNRISMLQQELELLNQKQSGVKLKFEIDQSSIEQQTQQALENSAMQFDQFQKQMVQQQVQNIVSVVTQAAAAINTLFEALDEANKARIDAQLQILDEQRAAIEERITMTEEKLSQTFINIDTLQTKAAEASGARRDIAIGLIEQEMQRSAKLQQQKKAEQDANKKLAEQQKALDAQKAQIEEEAAKRSMALSLVQQAANIAIAITQAATTPWPANIAAIASTIAAVVASLATVSSLVMKFEKGGQLPGRATGGLLDGPPHAAGGILAMAKGGPIAEVEGGEFVVNKRATRQFLPTLQAINSFANGGVLMPDPSLIANMPAAAGNSDFSQKIYEELLALNANTMEIARNPSPIPIIEVVKGVNNYTQLTEAPKI